MSTPRITVAAVATLALALTITACSSSDASSPATDSAAASEAPAASDAPASEASAAASSAEPYKFVISNNFLGNDWRPQTLKLAELTSAIAPYAGRVEVEVVNSQNTVEAQAADFESIVQSKPDAIFLISSSDSAFNAQVKKACEAGIVVITVETPIGEQCAFNVDNPFFAGMEASGEWMAKTLGGKGNVFLDRGISGLGVSETIANGFLAGLQKYGPDIVISGEFDGQYAPGPEQEGITNLLVAHPDVDGVMTQGYCTPVFAAMKAAGKPNVPAICYGYNGEMKACAADGNKCAIMTGSPNAIQVAMDIALKKLDGQEVPPPGEPIYQDAVLYMTENSAIPLETGGVVAKETLQADVNFFPALPDGCALPYTLPQFASEISPEEACAK